MRRPNPGSTAEIDPVVVYGRLPRLGPDRPSVRLHMIASVDGAVALAGRSGTLGDQADKVLFATLRSLADVVWVGAVTMRTEGYGPAQLAAAGLLDGGCLTVSPVVEGRGAKRTIRGAELAVPAVLALKSVLEADGYLFLRYGRR